MPDEPALCGGQPKPDHGDTPNGHFECEGTGKDAYWLWYPEIGRLAKLWNLIMDYLTIK
jgi:hypothetical protein